MKKRENKLQQFYKGNMLEELPLNLSLLSSPPIQPDNDKKKLKLTACSFYRVQYYQCYISSKRISRVIDPNQE